LRNYIYFSMFFAFAVEVLNIRLRSQPNKPVKLHNQATEVKNVESGD